MATVPKLVTAMMSRVKYVLLALTLIYLVKITFEVKPSLSPIHRARVATMDSEALDIWTEYVATHPVQVDERYSFREMGFRAHSYAELARTGQYGKLDLLEEKLWTFMPGAAKIRQKALAGNRITNRLGLMKRVKGNELMGDNSQQHKRGIIMVVDRNSVMSAFQSISVIRKTHKCDLPIEIYFHLEDELPVPLQLLLRNLGNVMTYDIDQLPLFSADLEDDAGRYPGWNIGYERQSLAILASQFQEIIVVDPDVVFLEDPSQMYSHPSFQKTGTLFFRSKAKPADRGSQYLISFIKRQFDQGAPSIKLSDSPFWKHQIGSRQDMGVVVLDKGRPGVLAALFLNAWTRTRIARSMVWGPHPYTMKEGLWLAFELSNVTYAFENTWPGAIGKYEGDWEDDSSPSICSSRTLQFLSPQSSPPSSAVYSYFSPFSNPETHSSQKASGTPFWFHGGLLTNPQIESYYLPNVWTRHVPYIEAANTPDQQCLYGATLKRLKGTRVPKTLEAAISAAHDAIESNRPVAALYAPVPAPPPPKAA